MTYWQAVRKVSWLYVTGWRFAPRHLLSSIQDLCGALGLMALSLMSLCRALFCLAAPLLVWLSPVATLIAMWIAKREEAAREKAREEIDRAQQGVKFKAQEGME